MAGQGIVRATFRKQQSDDHYGSETAEVTLEVVDTDRYGDTPEDAVSALLAIARRLVHDELRNSPSRAVQRGLEYPPVDPPL